MPLQFSKIFLLSFFFTFASIAYTQKIFSKIKNICESVELEQNSAISHNLYQDTSLEIVQTNCVEFFEFNITNDILVDRYLIFEVNFTNLPDDPDFKPLILEKKGEKPFLVFNHHEYVDLSSKNADIDAFSNRKMYHHIIVKSGDYSYNDTLYVGVFKVSTSSETAMDIPLEYTIQVRSSKKFPCPQNCSGRGYCSNSLRKCVCNKGFFDVDCGTEAIEILTDEFVRQKIDPNSKGVFYFLLKKEHLDGFELVLEKIGGLAKFFVAFDGPNDFSLPSSHNYLDRTSINYTEPQLILTISEDSLKNKEKYTLLVEAVNPQPEEMIVRAKISTNDNDNKRTLILLITIGATVSLLFVWIIISIIRVRTSRVQRARVRNGVDQRTLQQKIENIEKYSPTTHFEKLTTLFPHDTCAVCLEDFRPHSACRQLYCEHIFHSECIDSWLLRHNNCPICKKEMTKDILEKFYKTKKEAAQLQERKISQKNNDVKIEVFETSNTNHYEQTTYQYTRRESTAITEPRRMPFDSAVRQTTRIINQNDLSIFTPVQRLRVRKITPQVHVSERTLKDEERRI